MDILTRPSAPPSVLRRAHTDLSVSQQDKQQLPADVHFYDTIDSPRSRNHPPLPPKTKEPSERKSAPATSPIETTPYEIVSPLTPGKSKTSTFFGDNFKHQGTPPPLPPLGPPKSPKVVFGSENVVSLSQYNYDNFIQDKEKALVIFYDTTNASFATLAKAFGFAAEKSVKEMHCYGAVDCTFHRPLCCRESVTNTPALKLYSNGFIVSTIQEASKFTADQMGQLVSMSPVLRQPRGK